MRIYITFQTEIKSQELYNELKPFKMNVTDIGTQVYAYCSNILLTEIPQVLVICDKYGLYDLSITK